MAALQPLEALIVHGLGVMEGRHKGGRRCVRGLRGSTIGFVVAWV